MQRVFGLRVLAGDLHRRFRDGTTDSRRRHSHRNVHGRALTGGKIADVHGFGAPTRRQTCGGHGDVRVVGQTVVGDGDRRGQRPLAFLDGRGAARRGGEISQPFHRRARVGNAFAFVQQTVTTAGGVVQRGDDRVGHRACLEQLAGRPCGAVIE